MRISLVILAWLFTSCVNVKEVGKNGKAVTVLHCSANVTHLEFMSASGTHLVVDNFDPAATHTAIGNMVSKGIMSTGVAIATSGLAGKVKP